MRKCDSCGALNAPEVDKCGNCGKALSESDQVEVKSILRTDEGQADGEVHAGAVASAYSTAINIRRIFIILLTMLCATAASLITSLYVTFIEISDPYHLDRLEIVLQASIGVSTIIVLGGIVYAVYSKRLSSTESSLLPRP